MATVASKEVVGYVAYWHNVKATREPPQVFREYQKSGNPRVVPLLSISVLRVDNTMVQFTTTDSRRPVQEAMARGAPR